MFGSKDDVTAGGLISYGADFNSMYRHAAIRDGHQHLISVRPSLQSWGIPLSARGMRRTEQPEEKTSFQCVIRQIVPLASSDTRSAPSRATATPTGLPHTLESLMTNPVRKSWYPPVGDPSLRGILITLYPVRLDRFHDPCWAANPSPQYSDGNIFPL
jgi:hypothetical protein